MKIEIEFCDFGTPLPSGLSDEKVDYLMGQISSFAEGGYFSLESLIACIRKGIFGSKVIVTFRTEDKRVDSPDNMESGEANFLRNEGTTDINGQRIDYWKMKAIVFSITSEDAPPDIFANGLPL